MCLLFVEMFEGMLNQIKKFFFIRLRGLCDIKTRKIISGQTSHKETS